MSHPCGAVGVYNGIHKPVRYLSTFRKSDAAIDDVKYDVLGFVEHKVALDLSIEALG